jgi:hypothetical protein
MHSQPLQVFKHSFVQMAVAALFILAALPGRVKAQQNNAAASSTVPQIIEFSGQLASSPSGTVSITFTLYENEQGGTALWSETDNVQVDAQGHYTALLGSASPEGLPMNLFTTVQAHWLAVQPLLEGFGEQPRVLLVSAPYALKAGDAETIGGLPPSAFLRAASGTPSSSSSGSSGSSGLPTRASLGGPTGQPVPPPVTGTGTKNYIPLWTTTTKLGNSKLYQTAAGNVGLGTITPAATLEVNGTAQFDNTITFAAGQTFPGTGTITGVTAGTGLSGGGTSGSVMLNIASNACGSGNALTALPFTCSPFATLGANTFTGNQSVTGYITASGNVSASAYSIAGSAVPVLAEPGGVAGANIALGYQALFGNTTGTDNTAVGYGALNSNTTGNYNTASGYSSLLYNTTGTGNTASGYEALYSNTASDNTASGEGALNDNTSGGDNTASGYQALSYNTTGANNIAMGYQAGVTGTTANANTTGSNDTFLGYNSGPGTATQLTNATAIGANALVSASNALALGGTGANAVSVGIGTATPAATLEVNGTAQFDNTITFAAGQTFPGTGNGTITGVTAGSGLTGGGSSGSVTLSVPAAGITNAMLANSSLTVTPGTGLTGGGSIPLGGSATLSIAANACGSGAALTALPFTCTAFASLGGNSFSGNQNVTGNVTASGTVTGGTVNALQNYALNGVVVIDEPGSALNLALGSGALGIDQSLGYGGYNTAVGTQALYNNTASGNTASGYQALYANTNGGNNTASGAFALYSNVGGTSPQGSFNTASGANALYSNTTGSENTATGDAALYSNTTGSNNLADGYEALLGNTLGNDNTATGVQALYSNTGEGNYQGGYNTASGYQALYSNTQGGYNTAMGVQALYKTNDNAGIGGILNTGYGYQAGYNITSGQANIAIGGMAANNVSGGNNNNIEIGSEGSSGDSATIRIGCFSSSFCSSGFGFAPQTSFFVAGVRGVTTGQNNAVDVVIDSNGQLGTVSSSRRFKEDIHDMGDASYGLMRLRPVTFRYKKPFDDGSKPIQYGLIAEEVAEVYPDLVARSADGQIETVKYQLLDPMLLNEVQRQHGEIRDQKALVLAQQNQLKAQQALVHEQQIQLKTQQTQIAELLSSVKTIQASLHTRRGRGHAGLTSAKGAPAPATTAASLPLAPSARGGN